MKFSQYIIKTNKTVEVEEYPKTPLNQQKSTALNGKILSDSNAVCLLCFYGWVSDSGWGVF